MFRIGAYDSCCWRIIITDQASSKKSVTMKNVVTIIKDILHFVRLHDYK